MASSRIELFKQILGTDPENTDVLFGLAKEYEKLGDDANLIETLENYLELANDEGNAYGMLARGYQRTNQPKKAMGTYQRGIAAANSHGHPGMADEYLQILESEFSAP